MGDNYTKEKYSKWIMASYGVGPAFNQFFRMAFITFGFFFYEVIVGLNVWLVGFAYIIFAIWNAVNDPIVGYMTDRKFKFTKKWGRRFPWTIIGGIPATIIYVFIFAPPNIDPASGAWILFLWLVIMTCLFDTFFSIWWINFYAVFPTKFQTVEARRTASGIITPIGIIGITLGGILPPLFVDYNVRFSFFLQALIVGLVGFVMLLFGIPGWRDDKEAVKEYLNKYDHTKQEKSILKSFREVFHQKSFLIWIVIYFAFNTLVFCIQASLPYMVNFIFNRGSESQLFLQVSFLIGAIISIPFWITVAQRINSNKKTILISAFILSIITGLLTFISVFFILLIVVIFWGFALGGVWSMERPVLSDTIDQSVINTGKREEGTYISVMMFFNRISMLFQVIIFVIVHSLTGFEEGTSSQSSLANWGIQLHFGLIPMLILLIGVLIFWKFYDLTKERVEKNKERLLKIE